MEIKNERDIRNMLNDMSVDVITAIAQNCIYFLSEERIMLADLIERALSHLVDK